MRMHGLFASAVTRGFAPPEKQPSVNEDVVAWFKSVSNRESLTRSPV